MAKTNALAQKIVSSPIFLLPFLLYASFSCEAILLKRCEYLVQGKVIVILD